MISQRCQNALEKRPLLESEGKTMFAFVSAGKSRIKPGHLRNHPKFSTSAEKGNLLGVGGGVPLESI